MTQDWLLRVGNAEQYTKSSSKNLWLIDSTVVAGKYFHANAKPGDRLWFMKSTMKGKLVAVAIFKEFRKRDLGPLFSLTPTNEELGWTGQEGNWDTEVHYTDLFQIEDRNLVTEITGNVQVRLYDADKCKVNLPTEYLAIRPPAATQQQQQPQQQQGKSAWILFQERVQLAIHNKYTGAQLMQFASHLKNKKAYTGWTDPEIIAEAESFVPPPIVRKARENPSTVEPLQPQAPSPPPPTPEPQQPQPQPQEKDQDDDSSSTTPPSNTNTTTKTSSTKKKIPKKVKLDVWNTYIGAEISKHKCLCCKMTTIDRAEFDCGHVKSEANGGGLEISNLRPICSACNNSMSTMDMKDYVVRHGYLIG